MLGEASVAVRAVCHSPESVSGSHHCCGICHTEIAEMSVSHDFLPGTYFWVIIQQKVLTKLEFCVNLLFPLPQPVSYSDGISSCTDNNSSALMESPSAHRPKELEPISDFWRAPGAPGDHLC